MYDTQFLQIQFKLDFHWCASDKMSTKQIFKCFLCQHNRQQQIQRDERIASEQRSRILAICRYASNGQIHLKHMWPPARWLLYSMLLQDRLWTSLIAVQTAYLSLQKACLWNETQTWYSCCPSGTILPQSDLQQNNITVVQPSKTHFSHVNSVQGSVLFPWQALSLKPVTFDPSPQLTLLQWVSRGSSWYAMLL